jgi:hypothetical protein
VKIAIKIIKLKTFNQMYQLNFQSAPWRRFRYIIKDKDPSNTPLYRVRRSGFRKYRQFEDMNSKVLYYIDATTIKSVDTVQKTLATINLQTRMIETTIGNFTLNDLNLSQRSYILKLNDNIIAQVKAKDRLKHDQFLIEMKQIDEQHPGLIFALLVLINSVLERIEDPIMHSQFTCIPFTGIFSQNKPS